MFPKCFFGGLILIYCMTGNCLGAIQCVDPSGEPVDWFIIYKLPKISDHADPLVKEGYGHFYMDVNNPKWTLSPTSLKDNSGHALSYTLKQIYDNLGSKDVAYAMYNDQNPNGKTSGYYGHTKGSLAFDMNTGFWLVHSLPHYPYPDKYQYPDTGRKNGQTFLCMSLTFDQLDTVGKQWLYNNPWLYLKNFPKTFKKGNPNMADVLLENAHVKKSPYHNTEPLHTIGGQEFVSFAKFKKYKGSQDADLYSELVAPALGVDLWTETWQLGRGNLDSYCGDDEYDHQVENIKEISLPNDVLFSEHKDHSKWAVSDDKGNTWMCIGDINRQSGQFKRGGGTICFDIPEVHNAFLSSVNKVDECSTNLHDEQLDL